MSYEIVVLKPDSPDGIQGLIRIDELLNEGYRVAFNCPTFHNSSEQAVYLHKPPEQPGVPARRAMFDVIKDVGLIP